MRKLKVICWVAPPLVALIFLLVSLADFWKDTSTARMWQCVFLSIGSSIIGAWVVLFLERTIIGDPFSHLYSKLDMLSDSSHLGLLRAFPNRNTFFTANEMKMVFDKTRGIRIQGIALNFLLHNNLIPKLQRIAKEGGRIEILALHPDSPVLKLRDEKEGWQGGLKERLRTTLVNLVQLRKKYPQRITIKLFKGECHNMTILTDDYIVVNSYITGQKGWESPTFIFRRTNSDIAGSLDRQFKVAWDDQESICIENENDVPSLFGIRNK
jgi:hypothetical protein